MESFWGPAKGMDDFTLETLGRTDILEMDNLILEKVSAFSNQRNKKWLQIVCVVPHVIRSSNMSLNLNQMKI